MADARGIEFQLSRFEHLVETERGHIVRVRGTWSSSPPGDLPHPTLLAGPDDDVVRIAPLPIPDQPPPRADGETAWMATYSIPKQLFAAPGGVACRLQPASDVVVDLPTLEPPEGAARAAPQDRPPVPASAPSRMRPAPAPLAPSRPSPIPRVSGLYLGAVRAHRRLILAVVAVAALGSLLGLALRSPTYHASARLLVTPLPKGEITIPGVPEVVAGSDPGEAIATEAAIVRSRATATATAAALGHGWTATKVLDGVDVAPEGDSEILEVRATSDDPRLAARMANLFVQNALRLRDREVIRQAEAAIARTEPQLRDLADQTTPQAEALQSRLADLERVRANGDPTLQPLQPAAVPRSAAGLPAPALLLLTLLAGGVIGVAAAVLLDLVSPPRVQTEEELLARYRLPILARLPIVARGRVRPEDPVLREALRTLQVQLELGAGDHRALMVTSPSAGDGKTTTALAFALELAASGRTVVVMDLDLRKPEAASRLGVAEPGGLELLIDSEAALADVLVDVPGVSGLMLLSTAGPAPFTTLEALSHRLPAIVQDAAREADYVLLDTPPIGEISDALPFTRAVDEVLVVARLGRTSQGSLTTTHDLLDRVGKTPVGLIVLGGVASATATSYPVATGGSAP